MSIKSTISKIIKSLLSICLVAVFAFEAPYAHHQYLRHIAEQNVVRIVGMDGMGTGFQVETKSGKRYILTNKHVCKMMGPLSAEVYGNKTGGIRRNIIAISEKHDLCVLEGLPGVKGIKISSDDIKDGEIVYTLGHPRGEALNVTAGEKFDNKVIQLGQETEEDGTCSEGTLQHQFSIFGEIKFCLVTRNAIQFDTPTYPGNSGSPVVNKYGRLVSVVFAGSTQTENNGFGVPLSYVKDFLSSLK